MLAAKHQALLVTLEVGPGEGKLYMPPGDIGLPSHFVVFFTFLKIQKSDLPSTCMGEREKTQCGRSSTTNTRPHSQLFLSISPFRHFHVPLICVMDILSTVIDVVSMGDYFLFKNITRTVRFDQVL
jgi:hypothetical protein